MLYTPAGVEEAVESVRVVLQVAVQLAGAKLAATPAGSAEVVKVTTTWLPVRSVALTALLAEPPCATDKADGLDDRENVDDGGGGGGGGGGGAAAVVNV